MRFQIPQFIEVESKIFGPLTLKQFLYLLGGAGIIFIFYIFLPFWLMFLFAIPVGIFFASLAFYKYNNRPLIDTVENAFKYFLSSKIFIWRKEEPKAKVEIKQAVKSSGQMLEVPKINKNRLKELAWSLDIKEKN